MFVIEITYKNGTKTVKGCSNVVSAQLERKSLLNDKNFIKNISTCVVKSL